MEKRKRKKKKKTTRKWRCNYHDKKGKRGKTNYAGRKKGDRKNGIDK